MGPASHSYFGLWCGPLKRVITFINEADILFGLVPIYSTAAVVSLTKCKHYQEIAPPRSARLSIGFALVSIWGCELVSLMVESNHMQVFNEIHVLQILRFGAKKVLCNLVFYNPMA